MLFSRRTWTSFSPTPMPPRPLAALLLAAPAAADMYDVLQPRKVPPDVPGGCIPWADLPDYDKYWAAGAPLPGAGSSCVQWGNGPGNSHGYGAFCITNRTHNVELPCTSALGVPEQVNLQIASPDTVIAAFVTFEPNGSTPAAPQAALGTAEGNLTTELRGVTHQHVTAGGRVYHMHFVKFAGLQAKARYWYKVRSGGAAASWSDVFSFRAPYAGGETRIALYGDMGVFTTNNMANLRKDVVDDAAYDLIIHAGDHCYNEGDGDELRADGYMEAFELSLARAPWMPIVGNHEYYAGAQLRRYLDSTWEKWGPLPDGEQWGAAGLGGATSATSALGAFLSAGNHHGAGVHGAVPSGTSRYFSTDFGLTHLIALSLNGYNGVDTCTTECNAAQVEWLKQDLAAVDRSRTPWVIAMSHYPLYLSEQASAEDDEPLARMAWLNAEECEYEGHSRNCTPPGWTPANDVGLTLNDARSDLEPLFYQYGVDIYWAGHIHFYQAFHGALKAGQLVGNGTTNPRGVIHVCSGNGGPGSAHACEGTNRICDERFSYTRMTVHNATDLLWEQVGNADGKVFDSWTLHQDAHGPFPQ